MTESAKRLLELNANMDQIIELANAETTRMKNEIKACEEEAVNALNRALHEIHPIMEAVCQALRVNQYKEIILKLTNGDYYGRYIMLSYGNINGANYGLIIVRHGIENYRVSLWDDTMQYGDNCGMSERRAIADAKEYMTENVTELINKIYTAAEELLQKTIETKAQQQKELQNSLQTKLEMYRKG